jgi:hypothetical protein
LKRFYGHVRKKQMSLDLIDYFDPMDAGYPDRGSIEEQNRYLEKRRQRNLLGPAALARLRERSEPTTRTERPMRERVFVVKLKEGKPIKDITDLIGGRIWTLDGVEGGVTVTEIL